MNKADRDRLAIYAELVQTYDEYIELWSKESQMMFGLAWAHGHRTPDDMVQEGVRLRDKIAQIKELLLNPQIDLDLIIADLQRSRDEAWAAVHVRDNEINVTVAKQRETIHSLQEQINSLEEQLQIVDNTEILALRRENGRLASELAMMYAKAGGVTIHPRVQAIQDAASNSTT